MPLKDNLEYYIDVIRFYQVKFTLLQKIRIRDVSVILGNRSLCYKENFGKIFSKLSQ